MAECIHGFEQGFCDICFPRVAPEPVRKVTTPRTPRTSLRSGGESAKSTAAGRRAAAARVEPVPVVTLANQRVYHVTHLRNLEAILADGELRPAAAATPQVDVSSATTRELRATIEASSGLPVDQHVAFHLSPDAQRWHELRTGAAGSHWSDAARQASAQEFVVLVAPLTSLGEGALLTDGDAAAPATRFAPTSEDGLRTLRRLHVEGGALLEAEALATEPFPIESLALIGVANDPVRDRVRTMLTSAGLTTKVAVYPPWFTPVEEHELGE